MFDHRKSRPFTSAMLDALDQGMFDRDSLIADLLGYLSEAEVKDFVLRNDLLDVLEMDDDEVDEDYDGQPDEAQEWADFDPEC